jgi:hypothetical protein
VRYRRVFPVEPSKTVQKPSQAESAKSLRKKNAHGNLHPAPRATRSAGGQVALVSYGLYSIECVSGSGVLVLSEILTEYDPQPKSAETAIRANRNL